MKSRADAFTAACWFATTKATVTNECAGRIIRQRPAGVFAFPVFSAAFCAKLREECAHPRGERGDASITSQPSKNCVFLF